MLLVCWYRSMPLPHGATQPATTNVEARSTWDALSMARTQKWAFLTGHIHRWEGQPWASRQLYAQSIYSPPARPTMHQRKSAQSHCQNKPISQCLIGSAWVRKSVQPMQPQGGNMNAAAYRRFTGRSKSHARSREPIPATAHDPGNSGDFEHIAVSCGPKRAEQLTGNLVFVIGGPLHPLIRQSKLRCRCTLPAKGSQPRSNLCLSAWPSGHCLIDDNRLYLIVLGASPRSIAQE